jgi:hypothetical protein
VVPTLLDADFLVRSWTSLLTNSIIGLSCGATGSFDVSDQPPR